MNYKDMTFCPFYKDCAKAKDCHRPLTPAVKEAARKAKMHVCLFVDKPDCHQAVERKG